MLTVRELRRAVLERVRTLAARDVSSEIVHASVDETLAVLEKNGYLKTKEKK